MKKTTPREAVNRFLFVIASIIIGIAIGYFVFFVSSCGPVPHASCSAAQTWRCNENTVEMCNGSFWQPIQDCSEMWDEEGLKIVAECTVDKGSAQCTREASQ